jgi:Spx/MgsR family transcriptional regulator
MELIVYGIKSCDTIKKTLTWLEKKKIPYAFHDYKKESITETKLKNWVKQVGWEPLVNKKGTTWRNLPEAEQQKVTNEKAAITVMKEATSMIKRPVIEADGKVLTLGFDEAVYKELFNK